MTPDANTTATATFAGSRRGLLGVLAPGYVLMLFTLGIYRFWQVTAKRRYYWNHTAIDGDALEYTGTALQLLIGFMIAVAFFLPLYGFFFYLSTQSAEIAIIGYGGAAVVIYFLTGYAIYRARRFSLSRTLWRGIRFGQSGNAWVYALKRFAWTILVALTAGLAYPFMATSLWRYRYDNTWYGDRRFTFNGTWRTVAGPFYGVYFLFAALVAAIFVLAAVAGTGIGANVGVGLLSLAALLVGGLAFFYLKSRITSRFLSTVTAGAAAASVRIRARSLFWMYLLYAVMFALVTLVFMGLAAWMFSGLISPTTGGGFDMGGLAGMGWPAVAGFALMYLALLASWAALTETILGLGYWRMVARGAVIENGEDLKSVRARGDESALAGEGLADALNVGGY